MAQQPQLPDDMYRTAVVFDTRPTMQMAQQREAERQSKKDAFQEYIRGLNTKINTAGVRNIDKPVFDKKLKEWQDYGIKNRELIQKDPNAQIQFQTGYQELINMVNESKGEEEYKKPLVEILTDPNKRGKLRADVLPVIASHDEALYIEDKGGNIVRNSNRKRLDYTSRLFKEPSFDFGKHFKGITDGMKPVEVPGEVISTNPITGTARVRYTTGYDKQQVQQIATDAARRVNDDEDVSDYYQLSFENMDDKEFRKYNEFYQSVYGATVKVGNATIKNIVDSAEKLAAAEAIEKANVKTEDSKDVPDYKQRQQDKVSLKIINSGGGGRDGGGDDIINDVYGGIEAQVNADNDKGFGATRINSLDADAVDIIKKITGVSDANDLFLHKDKGGGIKIYKTGPRGQLIISPKTLIATLPKVGTNIRAQANVDAKKAVVAQGNGTPDKPQKTTTNKWSKYKAN